MKTASANILLRVLDDDPEELEIVHAVCEEHNVERALYHTDVDEFLQNMDSDINLCLVDHRLGLKTGLEVTRQIKRMNEDNYIMVSTLIRDFDIAVDYINAGANKWLKKYESNYIEQLVEALRDGFAIARARIHKAQKLKLLEHKALESMSEIHKMLEILNDRNGR